MTLAWDLSAVQGHGLCLVVSGCTQARDLV